MSNKLNFDKIKKLAQLVILSLIIIVNSSCANVIDTSQTSYKYAVTRSFDPVVIFEIKTVGNTHLLLIAQIMGSDRKLYSIKLKKHEYNQIINLFLNIQNLPKETRMNITDGSIWEAVSSSGDGNIKSFDSPLINTDRRGLGEFVELAKVLWKLGTSAVDLGELY